MAVEDLLRCLATLPPGYRTHRSELVANAGQPQLTKHAISPILKAALDEPTERSTTPPVTNEPAATLHLPASGYASSSGKNPTEATSSLTQASTPKRPTTGITPKGTHPAPTAPSQATARLPHSRPRPAVGGLGAADSIAAPAARLAAGAAHRKTRSRSLAGTPARPTRSLPLRRVAAGRRPHTTEPATASYSAEKYASIRRTDRPTDRAHMAT
nr:hypothetical protein [Tanacetum cinerariifolium]